MSSRPWVGCSWAPSPALITEQPTFWDSRCGVPGVECRTTIVWTDIDSMLRAVSMIVSPLDTLLPDEKLDGIRPKRRAAREKLLRVRVEFSKNRLAHVFPCSTANFL